MHRIDTPSRQKDKFGAGKDGFTQGDPQTGTQATQVSAAFLDAIQEEIASVIESSGLTLNKLDNIQLLKAIQIIAFGAFPVGAPIPWPSTIPPAGFLAMIGQPFNTLTYPKLAAAYPSGVLPDLRGEFIRGLDNGRGVDSGRVILSSQSSMLSSHTHNGDLFRVSNDRTGEIPYTTVSDRQAIVALGGGALSFDDYSVQSIGQGSFYIGNQPSSVTGGSENRPRNISFLYIVRAA